MNLFNRSPLGQKPAKAKPNPAYLAAVRCLPCCICVAFGMPQVTPTQAHHVCHGRFSTRRTPDEMAIPLCWSHHQGGRGEDKLALHLDKTEWRAKYGSDYDYTAVTQDNLAHVLVLK